MAVTAEFTATPLDEYMPVIVQFTDESVGAITSWLWDFGDNLTSTQQNPSHVYSYPGYYTIKLTVTDGVDTDDEEKEDYVKVHLVRTERKINYIYVNHATKTWDVAAPDDRIDLQVALLRGDSTHILYENGVKIAVRYDTVGDVATGFTRPQGPTLIFD